MQRDRRRRSAHLAGVALPGPDDAVSIVVPHYGDPAPTRDLAQSVLADPPPGGMQLIVSDDCSPSPYPAGTGVQLTRSARNRGFGGAVNAGASLATAPWLLVLNSDLRLPAGFLTELLREASAFQPAVCGVRQVDPATGRHVPAARGRWAPLSLILIRSVLLSRFNRQKWFRRAAGLAEVDDEVTGPVDWLVGSLLLMPRVAFEAAGGFDEDYFMYGEEVDLQRRLKAEGIPSILLANFAVQHEGGASSGAIDVQAQQLRSQLLFIRKWYGQVGLGCVTAGLIAVAVADALVEALRRRPTPAQSVARDLSNRLRTTWLGARRARHVQGPDLRR